MPVLPRLLGPAAVAFIVAPVGNATILLAAFATLNLTVGLIALRDLRAGTAARRAPRADERQLALVRRTEPQLRARRPASVIEAQVKWRQAAEAHRRTREFPGRLIR